MTFPSNSAFQPLEAHRDLDPLLNQPVLANPIHVDVPPPLEEWYQRLNELLGEISWRDGFVMVPSDAYDDLESLRDEIYSHLRG